MNYSNAEMADILHRASSLYMASNIPIDYGTGEKYTPVEVHMLKYIIDHPQKTLTDLSVDWDKAKASVSQMLTKLEKKGLIVRESVYGNKKKVHYKATEKGYLLNQSHQAYDEKTFGSTLAPVRAKCEEADIQNCFFILEQYCIARKEKHYHSFTVKK